MEELNEEPKIIIFYVDVRGIENHNIPEIVRQVQSNVEQSTAFATMSITSIVIPILSNTRIECINPKYITEANLISKHELLMKELHEHLAHQVDQLKAVKAASEEFNKASETFFSEIPKDETTDGK